MVTSSIRAVSGARTMVPKSLISGDRTLRVERHPMSENRQPQEAQRNPSKAGSARLWGSLDRKAPPFPKMLNLTTITS